MKSFRPVFAERYPWVQKLLDQEKITLRVDEELYQGSTEEILVRCQKKFSRYGENHFQPNNRKTLTQNWLEALLVVDFLFACGSHQDRIDGQKLLEYVFDPVAQEIRSAEGRIGHSQELEIPAIFDLAIALADDYPQHATENLVNSLGIFLKTCKQPVDFAQGIKWIIRNAEFKKWPEMQRLYCNLTNNLLVEQGLLSEAIYWNHLKDGVRPSKGSGQKVVEILFMRIFQEKGSQEYAKYLTLLDQAYPEGNPPSN